MVTINADIKFKGIEIAEINLQGINIIIVLPYIDLSIISSYFTLCSLQLKFFLLKLCH